MAVFDNLFVRKYHVDIHGVRYPRDGVRIDYASNDSLDQHRDLKLFYKKFVGEELLNLFMSYTDMKKNILFKPLILDFKLIIIIQRKFN